MKFKIERKRLQAALQKVMRTAAPLSAVKLLSEALSGVLVEADSDKRMLVLTATDLTVSMQMKLKEVEVEEAGTAVVRAKILVEMLDRMQDEIAVCSALNNIVTLHCGRSVFRGPVMAAKDFPRIALVYPDNTIRVTGLNLLAKQAVTVVSERNDNPMFQGVQMRFSPSVTTATSSDGIRMVKSKNDGMADGNLDLFVPERALKILCGIAKSDDDLFVGVVNNIAVFMTSEFVFNTRLTNGNLDKIETMMEKIEAERSVTVNTKSFAQAVDTLSSACYGCDPCVNLTLTTTSMLLWTDNENGHSQIEVDAEKSTSMLGKVVHYRPNFILEALRLCSGTVTVDFDQRGIMRLRSSTTDYVISPRTPARVKAAETTEKVIKTKKGKAAKSSEQAA